MHSLFLLFHATCNNITKYELFGVTENKNEFMT